MILFFIGFIAILTGLFLLLHIQPAALVEELREIFVKLQSKRKLTLQQQIKRSLSKREPKGIHKIIVEAIGVLKMTYRMDRLPSYITASSILCVAGLFMGFLMENYMLAPVLAVGLPTIPWLVILLGAPKFKTQLNQELENATSLITTSYRRVDNIVDAIQENVSDLHRPVKDVFDKFLIQAHLVSPDIPALLAEMKLGINNDTFDEWVDKLIQCQENRTLKSTLQPIVDKFSEVREVNEELNLTMYDPLKEFISMAVLTVMNYPLFFAISRDEWYASLMYTQWGQVIVALTFVSIFISLPAVIRLTRPVEFKR